MSPSEYEKRFVGYFDILGFNELIKQSISRRSPTNMLARQKIRKMLTVMSLDDRGNISSRVAEKRKDPEHKIKSLRHQIRGSSFSDNLVISAESSSNCFDLFMDKISRLYALGLSIGLLVRGAITYGLLYHDDWICFGPALSQAVETETKIAEVPRIVITKKVMQEIKRIVSSDMCNKYCSKDSDRNYYVNIVPSLQKNPHVQAAVLGIRSTSPTFEEAFEKIQQAILSQEDTCPPGKYAWLEKKFLN